MKRRKILFLAAGMTLALLLSGCVAGQDIGAPGVTLSVDPGGDPQQVSSGVQLLLLITIASLAPAILTLATSFTRIVIVLSLLRNAVGIPTAPPSQVIVGLALLLTFFVMTPVINQIQEEALEPYLNMEIDQNEALDLAIEPVRDFMFDQTREKELELFLSMSTDEQPATLDDIPTSALLPAFVISELRTAFIMGFMLYVPFLVIDMVVSSILLAMGMMMLPPSLISLPFKILLFVMVDGWYLVARSLVQSFAT
jgi:flagellar biosynthesis protein FliP